MATRRYEEMGSTNQRTTVGGDSSSSSSSSSSPSSRAPLDSLNGLKFGQKIYFGDVGLGVSGISGGGSSSSPSPAAKKGRAAGAQSGQPPRCQVEGCDVDLTDAKAYYSRHKVCCMHSKSSKVVVGGIEQRFCQQCSRFHQLAEFDHGKRSCRRRLAGHNERRRKPPPGSLLSARLGRLSPSVFDSSSSGSGFLVDFTASLKAPDRSSWPGTKTAPNHSTDVGKFLQGGAWPGQHHPSSPGAGGMFLQSSAGGTNYHQVGPTIPSGECFAGVTDSSCALSLLSNQDWSSGNRAPCIGPTNLLNTGGTSICQQSSGHHGHFHDIPWGFKVGESSHGMNCVPSNLGLGQVSHPLPSRTASDGLDMGQPSGGASGRQLVEFEHSTAYGSSTEHMHWLL